jgi:hypothetical protein
VPRKKSTDRAPSIQNGTSRRLAEVLRERVVRREQRREDRAQNSGEAHDDGADPRAGTLPAAPRARALIETALMLVSS